MTASIGLPDTLGAAAEVTPLKHVIVLIQDPWLGFGWNTGELVVVLSLVVVAAAAAAHWLAWDYRRARTRAFVAR